MEFNWLPFNSKEWNAANRPWTSWNGSEVQEGSVETNLLFHFSDLYCDHLMLSERSLRGCIGFGGSAQAGEKPKHCGCIGIDNL